MNAATSTDPRAIRSREAILQAAVELLEDEGPPGLTHQRVAERAGVGRATVYRHWPQPLDLFTDVMGRVEFPWLEQSDGTLRERMGRDLRRLRDDLDVPITTTVIASVIDRAQRDDAIKAMRDRLTSGLAANMRAAIDDAVSAGELRAPPDAVDLVAQTIGPLLYRRAMEGGAAPDAFLDRVVDDALAPWLA